MKKCAICGRTEKEGKVHLRNGVLYCKRHYMQMYKHGKILERTIYDSNEYIIEEDRALICLYDNKGKETGRAIIDLEDVEKCKKYKWYLRKNGKNNYVYGKKKQKTLLLHRFLLKLEKSTPIVDHINNNGLDNRRENLRLCTYQENIRNMKKDKTIGVNFDKAREKWTANIFVDGKNIFLGRYDSFEEAKEKRFETERKYFKDFAPQAK